MGVEVLARAVVEVPDLTGKARAANEWLRGWVEQTLFARGVREVDTVRRMPVRHLAGEDVLRARQRGDRPPVPADPEERDEETQPMEVLELALIKRDATFARLTYELVRHKGT